MNRSRFTFIGLLLTMLLTMHAAMLAGGGHATEAHDAPMHAHHGGMAMSHSEPLPRAIGPELPQMQLPGMVDCELLGVAVLRVEIVLDSTLTEALISTVSTAIDRPAVYAPFVSAFSRSQLQVFLI
ncbi:hypothetical protein BH09CHL1_BH09CHL1_35040 [soil metagenome]